MHWVCVDLCVKSCSFRSSFGVAVFRSSLWLSLDARRIVLAYVLKTYGCSIGLCVKSCSFRSSFGVVVGVARTFVCWLWFALRVRAKSSEIPFLFKLS
jgi:hypothetical protein